MVAVRNLFAVRPNPRAGETIRPLDIKAQMNQSFTRFLKHAKPEIYARHDRSVTMWSGVREIGFVPMQLGPKDGNNCIVIKKGDPKVSIPITGRFSSLIFLHTAHLRSRDGIKPTTYREWPYGFPCGDYVVRCEDGSQSVLPLRFEYNIRRFAVPRARRYLPLRAVRCVRILFGWFRWWSAGSKRGVAGRKPIGPRAFM